MSSPRNSRQIKLEEKRQRGEERPQQLVQLKATSPSEAMKVTLPMMTVVKVLVIRVVMPILTMMVAEVTAVTAAVTAAAVSTPPPPPLPSPPMERTPWTEEGVEGEEHAGRSSG